MRLLFTRKAFTREKNQVCVCVCVCLQQDHTEHASSMKRHPKISHLVTHIFKKGTLHTISQKVRFSFRGTYKAGQEFLPSNEMEDEQTCVSPRIRHLRTISASSAGKKAVM